jgi:hypothetical protein
VPRWRWPCELLGLGAAGVVVSSIANTRIQLSAPSELRGRVIGIFFLVFVSLMPLGSLTVGTLSEQLGVQAALIICATLCATGVLGAVVYARRIPIDVAISEGPAAG